MFTDTSSPMFEVSSPELITKEKELKSIFGDNCHITEKNDDKINVSVELADGIAKGGQKIEVILSKMVELDSGEEVKNRAYPCDKLIVNGVDISNRVPKIYFFVRDEISRGIISGMDEIRDAEAEYEKSKEKNNEDNSLKLNIAWIAGSHARIVGLKSVACMTTMRTAEDLVNLFHEFGHVKNLDNYKIWSDLTKKHFNFILFKHSEEFKNIDSSQRARLLSDLTNYRKMEQAASNTGLKIIEKLEPEVKMFEGDDDLLRVKKSFFTTTTMSFIKDANLLRDVPLGGDELLEWTDI